MRTRWRRGHSMWLSAARQVTALSSASPSGLPTSWSKRPVEHERCLLALHVVYLIVWEGYCECGFSILKSKYCTTRSRWFQLGWAHGVVTLNSLFLHDMLHFNPNSKNQNSASSPRVSFMPFHWYNHDSQSSPIWSCDWPCTLQQVSTQAQTCYFAERWQWTVHSSSSLWYNLQQSKPMHYLLVGISEKMRLVLTFLKSKAASISSITYSGVGL